MAAIMRFEVSSRSEDSALATHRTAAGTTLQTDEHPRMGGSGGGPNPLEAVLAAWAGCLVVMTRMVARERSVSIGSIDVRTLAEIDPRGLMGDRQVRAYYTSARAELAAAGISPEELREIVQTVERRCPVSGLLAAAGVEIRVEARAV